MNEEMEEMLAEIEKRTECDGKLRGVEGLRGLFTLWIRSTA